MTFTVLIEAIGDCLPHPIDVMYVRLSQKKYSSSITPFFHWPTVHLMSVKAFNTVFMRLLSGGADLGPGRTVPVLVASDSARAKPLVRTLGGPRIAVTKGPPPYGWYGTPCLPQCNSAA